MRRSSTAGWAAGVVTLAIMLWSTGAMAGQFKNLHGVLANPGCISAHSSPRNVSSAMGIEIYEFVTPATDFYRCCITSNATGQDLFVRLMGLTGLPLASFQTAVNGGGCTANINLLGSFAFQCTVSSGSGAPVSPVAHYVFAACRQ
jgi:hypothetical protein